MTDMRAAKKLSLPSIPAVAAIFPSNPHHLSRPIKLLMAFPLDLPLDGTSQFNAPGN
jgi:hypothetical protein